MCIRDSFLALFVALLLAVSATAAVFYFGKYDIAQYADIAKIVTSFASVMVLSASATAAVFIYSWQRKSGRIEATKKLNDDLREYNLLVINNEELQILESESHPWGEKKLTPEEVKKMYFYFILINVSYNLFASYVNSSIDKKVYKAQLDNTANNTSADRRFIEDNVFPRGYAEDFIKEITERWDFIEKSKSKITKNNKFKRERIWRT